MSYRKLRAPIRLPIRSDPDYVEKLRALRAETESAIDDLLMSIGIVMLWLTPTSPQQWRAVYKALESMTARQITEWIGPDHPSRDEFFRRYRIPE